MKRGFILIFWLFFLIGCNNELTVENSILDADFPVPKKAKVVEEEIEEKYVKYQWKIADELESIHKDYLRAIKAAGWLEVKEEQMGALRVFKKEDKRIHLMTHNGYFILSDHQ